MPGRVLSTQQARDAITKMRSIIDSGLSEQITQLDAQGRVLSDPNVWDGALAGQFRAGWPTTAQNLTRMRAELDDLRTQVDHVTQNILTAGGN